MTLRLGPPLMGEQTFGAELNDGKLDANHLKRLRGSGKAAVN